MSEERLHKYLARCGVASRRKAETFILDGRVSVNGAIVTILGTKVGPTDDVAVDGVPVKPERPIYVLMNKPRGVLTTLSDPQRRPTVAQYLPELGVTLKPVGRLDMDSEGLILFTNDGDFAQAMTHAKHGIEKEYDAVVLGDIDDKDIDRMRRGILIDGRRTGPAYVEKLAYDSKADRSRLRIILREGRNRQVRRMADAVGHPVEELRRVRIGHLVLKKIRAGECILLGKVEVDRLQEAAAPADPTMALEPDSTKPPKPRARPKSGDSKDRPKAAGTKRRPPGGGSSSRRPKPSGDAGEGTERRKPTPGAKRRPTGGGSSSRRPKPSGEVGAETERRKPTPGAKRRPTGGGSSSRRPKPTSETGDGTERPKPSPSAKRRPNGGSSSRRPPKPPPETGGTDSRKRTPRTPSGGSTPGRTPKSGGSKRGPANQRPTGKPRRPKR